MRQRVALCDQKDPSDLGFSAPNAVMRLPLFLRDRTSPARSAMSGKCQQQKCRSVCWQPVSSRQARNFEFELVLSAFVATACKATSSVSRRDDFARLPL